MSWNALAWAGKQRVGHAHTKAVLILLANYADEAGSCFPSNEHLGDVLEVSIRTIQNAVTTLEEAGYLTRTRDRNKDGTLGLTRYRLNLDRLPGTGSPQEARSVASASSATGRANLETDSTPPGVGVASGEPPARGAGGDHRQTGSEPPAHGAPATGTACRSDSPEDIHQQESIERDARASDQEQAPSRREALKAERAELLARLKAAYPHASQADQDEVDATWAAMLIADCRAAVDKLPAWLADRGPRQQVTLGLVKYLKQKPWEIVAAKAAPAAARAPNIDAFSRAWWWLFHRMIQANWPEWATRGASVIAALRQRTSAARSRLPWPVDEDKRAAIHAAAEALATAHVDGEAVKLWRERYRALGIEMPLPDIAQWIFVPAVTPEEWLGGQGSGG
jgi:hypothetical protein